MTGPERPASPPSTAAPPQPAAQARSPAASLPETAAASPEAMTARALGWLSRDHLAIAAGLAGPLALAAILVPFRTNFANTDAALAMILLVVAVAAAGNRMAGYVAAVSAAAWFDFFLTRPYEQFTINRATDIETTILLLVIGIAVTEIAVWGRRQHASRQQASRVPGGNQRRGSGGRDRGLAVRADRSDHALADPAAVAAAPASSSTASLALAGRPGSSMMAGSSWTASRTTSARAACPPARAVELLVESGGRLQGRFLMQPDPAAEPTREQLLVAAALADQAGAALAASYPAAT